MSWSVAAVGRAQAVANRLKAERERMTGQCAEPEESIKNSVLDSMVAAASVFPPNTAIEASAAGSQMAPDLTKPGERYNTMYVKLQPVYGFIAD